MALPDVSMRQLLEAGVHFGHTTRRWNPKMAPYIFGKRNGVHILDLEQTLPLLHQSLVFVRDVVAGGGRVLFVGTKRQASEKISESAKRCGQYYVNHRWLGGMLTNWKTISQSIRRLREVEEGLDVGETTGLTKKELLNMTREHDKLERALGGIKEMGGLPDVLFVIDTNKEHIAVAEAKVLNIPVIAILDSNSDPSGIAHPVPGNDDAIRSIELYCDLMSGAVLEGIQAELEASGGDVGEAPEGPVETLPEAGEAPATEAPATEAPATEAPATGAPATGAPPAEASAEAAAPVEAPKPAGATASAEAKPAEAGLAEAAPAKPAAAGAASEAAAAQPGPAPASEAEGEAAAETTEAESETAKKDEA
jgi:small subunit ribosomal protein S2